MPVITVITPVRDGGHHFLRDAYDSVQRQVLPHGWTWEWVVQEDGRTRRPAGELPKDHRVRFATAPQGGAGVARTVGLARAAGSIVRGLDADDKLTDGALARDIETLLAHPHAGWCISSCLDLLPDGSLHPGPYDPPAGALSLHELRTQFEEDRFPVVGTHLAARVELVRAVGGWPALPALEALALVLVCAAVSPGHMIETPGGIYRKHAAQMTAQPSYRDNTKLETLRTAILSRLDALQSSGWRWPPHAQESS
jgi:hypothetical protein